MQFSICNSTIKYYNNTTNLKQHLSQHNQTKEPEIETELIQLFTSTLLPLSLIENEYFIKYSKSLNSQVKLPTFKTLSIKIEQTYESKKNICKNLLSNIPFGSLIINGWSNNFNYFIGIIFYYIDSDWIPKSMLLEFEVFNINYTGENIAFLIENVTGNRENPWKVSHNSKESLKSVK